MSEVPDNSQPSIAQMEWSDFQRSHFDARSGRVAHTLLIFLAISDFFVFVFQPLFLGDPFKPMMATVVSFVVIMTILILKKIGKISKSDLVTMTATVIGCHIMFNAWFLYDYFSFNFEALERLQMFMMFVFFSAVLTMIVPFVGVRWNIFAACSYVVVAIGVSKTRRLFLAETVVFLAGTTVFVTRYILMRFFSAEMQLEFERIKGAQIEEKSRQNVSLELARKLQSSVMPDPEIRNDSILVQTFQRTYETVGGDWVGVRNAKQKTIIVVADATGKGFQAALVVHAIQALWASSINQEFHPESWLTTVNDTLCYLGKREKHTATIGILSVDKHRVEYWSAGHTPVFWREAGGEKVVHALANNGSIPGISEQFFISSVEMKLKDNVAYEFIIGSDGVIDRKGVYKKSRIGEFIDELKTSGVQALDALTIKDDRSIVLISRAPVAASILETA